MRQALVVLLTVIAFILMSAIAYADVVITGPIVIQARTTAINKLTITGNGRLIIRGDGYLRIIPTISTMSFFMSSWSTDQLIFEDQK